MPCPRCGFFNLPGAGRCVSCGGAIGEGVVAVAVEPPRAKPWRKRVRKLQRALFGNAAPRFERRLPAASALLGLVPALPQLARGERRAAALFGGAWLASAALGAWLLGHPLGALGFGGAIGAHAMSALQPYRDAMRGMGRWAQAGVSLAAWFVLLAAVYAPARRAATGLVLPVELNVETGAPFAEGDTVLTVPRAPGLPRRGEIVVAETRAARLGGIDGGLRYGEDTALVIDRVLALPGDEVAYRNGTWSVNGAALPRELGPLGARVEPPPFTRIVPAGTVFVWPSLSLRRIGGGVAVPDFGLLPASALTRRPWRIAAPFGRRGPVEAN
jgi:hypothetical protein